MIKWLFVAVMLIHGLIHLMGALSEIGITEIEDLSGKTLLKISDGMKKMLGVVWLLTMVLFLVSTYGFITEQNWWQMTSLFSVLLSQSLVIIWWPDAKFGTFANIMIFFGIAYDF